MVEPKRPKPPKHWSDWTVEERKAQVVELGLPGFRADQFSRQWYQRLNNDTASWTDVPADMREVVKELLFPELMTSIRELKCDNGATVKQVWKLFDGVLVESVLMRYTDRTTMCISSQAGCGMNCPFCATGQSGLTRNLSTAEIVEQVLAGARSLAKGEIDGGIGRVNNLVFMGMGEPMANYKSVIGAIRRLTEPAPAGFGMSARGITVSTVGLVPRMRQLAEEGIPVTLAVSLHAPDDELRDTLVPINTRFKVQEVLDAAWYYADKTGRRISIEYAMIKDINDQAWRADLLGEKLAGNLVHVNLIPLNPTPGSKWTASRQEDEDEFVRRLKNHGVPVTVRETRGRDIDGACGQLAAATKN
jgi:23S rRNA (adenine2503-C2)-methyltransferase